jgi:hypothetical protein
MAQKVPFSCLVRLAERKPMIVNADAPTGLAGQIVAALHHSRGWVLAPVVLEQ